MPPRPDPTTTTPTNNPMDPMDPLDPIGPMDIGFCGLGAMGAPMAARLRAAGHRLHVHNRSPAKAAPLIAAGATAAPNPAAAASTGLVFTMLTGDDALAAVCHGPQGILAGLPPGGVHVSCSTIATQTATDLEAEHRTRGQHLVTACVLGRPPAAASGTLFIMTGGEPEPLARIAPLLAAIGQRVFALGAAPAMANLVKLCANFLIFSTIEQLAEVFAIAAKAGVDRAALFACLTESFFSAPVHRNYGRLILDRAYDGVGTDVALALKDTGMLLAASAQLAAPMPLANLVQSKLQACAAQGELALDFSVLARQAERAAGLIPAPPP